MKMAHLIYVHRKFSHARWFICTRDEPNGLGREGIISCSFIRHRLEVLAALPSGGWECTVLYSQITHLGTSTVLLSDNWRTSITFPAIACGPTSIIHQSYYYDTRGCHSLWWFGTCCDFP